MQIKFNKLIYWTMVWGYLFFNSIPLVQAETDLIAQQSILAQENKDDEVEDNESQLQGIPLEINEIAQEITVRIDTENGNGSGVIFAVQEDKNDENLATYYVLTAKHVVDKNQKYTVVTVDGESYPIDFNTIKKFDNSDLAVISFKSEYGYYTARFGDYQFSFNEEPWVFVYGWAESNKSPQAQFSAGKIAGKETGIFLVKDDASFAEENGYELVYTNLSEGGMSGGAVLDTNGRLIGIHASAEGEDRYKLANELQLGFSLGIPVRTFLNSEYAQSLINEQQVEFQTTKERLDIDPFAQPKLSQSDLESIQNNLTQIPSPTDSDSEAKWLNYGNQLWRLSRYSKAIAAFDTALEKQPDFYQAHYGKGLATYNQGDFQTAVAEFEQATQLKADFYPAWYRKSLCLLALRQYDEALSSIESAIALQPENTALYILKGEALQNLPLSAEAIEAYNQAITNETNSIVLVRRGSLYRNLEQYDLALQDFNQAANANPKYIETYINRGLTYYRLGKYDRALGDLNHAIKLDYQNPRAYLARGLVNHELKELSQSSTDFYLAWNLYNKNKNTATEISNVSSQPNKYAQVPTDFSSLLRNNQTSGYLDFGKSVAFALIGEQDKAIAHLKQASSSFQTQQDNSSYQLTQALLQQITQTTSQAINK